MITTEDLLRLRSGELPFDHFARQTRPDFTRLAQKLLVGAPAWLDVDDVVQEMLLVVPRTVQQWKPGDYPLKRFVVFRTCAAARKLIKRARDYLAHEGRVVTLDRTGWLEHDREERPTQHARLEVREHVEALMQDLPETTMQLAVLRALVTHQSADHAIQDLIKHPDTRVMFAADRDLVKAKMRRVMSILANRAAQRRSSGS